MRARLERGWRTGFLLLQLAGRGGVLGKMDFFITSC